MQLYQPTITGSLAVSGSVSVSGSITIAGGGSIAGTASIATTALTASSADNFLTRGTLTAQTIVVQTITSSVDFVTGSTRFGSLTSDTHQFTGSMSVTGALYVTTGSVGIGTTNPAVNFHVYSTTANTQVNVETLASGNSYTQYTLKSGTGAGAAFFLNSATRTTDGGANVAIIRNDVGSLRLQSAGSSGATDAGLTISGSLSHVGIGTTNPASVLTIYNSASAASASGQEVLRLQAQYSLSVTGSGAVIQFTDPSGNYAGAIKSMHESLSANVGIGLFTLSTTQQERVRILANGNVGIGSSIPGYTLDVFNSTEANLRVRTSSATGLAGIYVANGNRSYSILTRNSAGNVLEFRNETDNATAFSVSGSRVGIGVTNPSYRLEVLGDGAGTGELAVKGSGTDIGIALNNTGTGGKSWRILSSGGGSGAGNGSLVTWDGTGYGWTINSSRNVGIGTTNPSELLHLYGTGTSPRPALFIETSNASATPEVRLFQSSGRSILMNLQTNGDWSFQNSTNNSTYNTRMTITSGGGIAIGTGSVASNTTMHIALSGAGKQGLLIENTGADEATMRFKSAHSLDSDFRIGASIGVSNSFEIYSTRAAATRVYINSSGSTAFGTTTNVSQSYFSVGSVVAAGIMRVRAGQSNDTIRDTSAFGSSMSGTSDWSMVIDRNSNGVANGALFRNGRNTSSNDSPFLTTEANHPDCGGTSVTVRHRLWSNGNGTCSGAWTGGGADYAEYFEWEDGNPNNEDRIGYAVSLVGNKIKIAELGETIIGIISASPSVIGDDGLYWKKKFLTNDLGEYILDENGGQIVNPEFDPNIPYIPRSERKEWAVVGLMGKIRMRKGQLTMPSWIKMRDISDTVEEWLVK